MDGWLDGLMVRQMGGWVDRWITGLVMSGWKDGCVGGFLDGWIGERMDGWME